MYIPRVLFLSVFALLLRLCVSQETQITSPAVRNETAAEVGEFEHYGIKIRVLGFRLHETSLYMNIIAAMGTEALKDYEGSITQGTSYTNPSWATVVINTSVSPLRRIPRKYFIHALNDIHRHYLDKDPFQIEAKITNRGIQVGTISILERDQSLGQGNSGDAGNLTAPTTPPSFSNSTTAAAAVTNSSTSTSSSLGVSPSDIRCRPTPARNARRLRLKALFSCYIQVMAIIAIRPTSASQAGWQIEDRNLQVAFIMSPYRFRAKEPPIFDKPALFAGMWQAARWFVAQPTYVEWTAFVKTASTKRILAEMWMKDTSNAEDGGGGGGGNGDPVRSDGGNGQVSGNVTAETF